jgi:hypothetical protein
VVTFRNVAVFVELPFKHTLAVISVPVQFLTLKESAFKEKSMAHFFITIRMHDNENSITMRDPWLFGLTIIDTGLGVGL